MPSYLPGTRPTSQAPRLGGRLLTPPPSRGPAPSHSVSSSPSPPSSDHCETGRCPPPSPRLPAEHKAPPVWGLDPARPYLVDEEHLGSHIDAHSRHGPDSGIHTWEGVGGTSSVHGCQDPGPPSSGGAEPGVGGPAAGHRVNPSHFSFGAFRNKLPRVKPGNSPSGLTQPECGHQVCANIHHFRPHRAPAPPTVSTMT